MKAITKNTLMIGCGFAGGFIAGKVMTQKGSREKLQHLVMRLERLLAVANRQGKILRSKSSEGFRFVTGRVKKELSDPLPDLYKATESLSLEDDDLIYER
jgi:hypothetical protein